MGSLYVGISTATRMPFGASVTGAGGWLSMFHTDHAFRMRPASGKASKVTRIQAMARFHSPDGIVNRTRHVR
ncbi:hypothetical protein SRABI128_05288 [Microbacterium sp. Bi128]|nr:hypothetical protein SRABI128_05288 [Microbacterium sp. Bi128]